MALSFLRQMFALAAVLSVVGSTNLLAQEIRYTGALTQNVRGEGDQVIRRFEVLLLQSEGNSFFTVLDDEREGCPWPESFGSSSNSSGPDPHLIYNYDGSLYTLPLPALALELPDDIADSSEWTSGNWSYRVGGPANSSDGNTTWQILATGRRGRRQTLQVDAETGTLVQAKLDVFMGQGDRFEMTLTRTSLKDLSNAEQHAATTVQTSLMQLQKQLNRRPDTQTAELSPRQIELASALLTSLRNQAQDTALHETVIRIGRDVERQKRRVAASMNRQEALLNRPAPSFALNMIDGSTLSSESLAGHVTVLHFWDYKDKPLSEPYGQIGYLDFLYNRRKSSRVQVIGIATNPALQSADSLQRAQRSARKLVEFMNTTYPVGYDDGSLLRAFGDPRESDGELPLWVVLSADGKVVHYRSGFYEIDRQRGLKELDDVLIEQVRASK